jgi:hypothetical protein
MSKLLVLHFICFLLITQSILSLGSYTENDDSIALLILKSPHSYPHSVSVSELDINPHLKTIKRNKQSKKDFYTKRRYGFYIGRK